MVWKRPKNGRGKIAKRSYEMASTGTKGNRGLMGEKGLIGEDWNGRNSWRKKII
jgi:hypothetical protein